MANLRQVLTVVGATLYLVEISERDMAVDDQGGTCCEA